MVADATKMESIESHMPAPPDLTEHVDGPDVWELVGSAGWIDEAALIPALGRTLVKGPQSRRPQLVRPDRRDCDSDGF